MEFTNAKVLHDRELHTMIHRHEERIAKLEERMARLERRSP